MSTVDDLEQVIMQYDLALGEFYKGNPEPVQRLYSHRDEVTLAPPFGPPTHGWDEAASMERGASQFRDGENVGFEIIESYVTSDLAYVVWVERAKSKVGGGEDVAPIALRVTMIFRPEEGTWKVVHRHAAPITTRRPAESVIQD
jgi:ketosteroid isomerase-like protein